MKNLATHFSVILFVPVTLYTASAAFGALEAQATRAHSQASRPFSASEFPDGQAYFGPTWHLDPL